MTTPTTMALTALAAKGADTDFIKQTLQFALQRLMEMDIDGWRQLSLPVKRNVVNPSFPSSSAWR